MFRFCFSRKPASFMLRPLLLLLGSLLLSFALRAQTQHAAPSAQEIERERLRWNRSLVQDTAYKFNR